ncbi:MAG TPA: Do family serine endopeptidase [Pirellulales bacterium]|jgi:serine protease Do|nr:Do family serine endopeptidase [Pirellulales bacterium]
MLHQFALWKRKAVAAVAIAALVGGAAIVAPHAIPAPLAWAQAPTDNTRMTGPANVEQANGLSNAFRQAANTILPTVVTIETHIKPRAARNENPKRVPRENPFKGTPFEDFFNDENSPFGPNFNGGDHATPRRSAGTGSGVIIDPSGVILTNNHVVEGADEVTVRLADGREFTANDIKTDPETDLAVVRIKGAGTLPAAKLGNSDAMEIGDWVIAVGNPFGLDQTVSAGIISGKGRDLRAGQRTRYLQTDAAINPGNSGGPLVNLKGEVVGINTAIASNSGGYQGVGFAIPVNLAKWVTQQLVSTGSVRRAYLGVGIEMLNNELAEKFGVERGKGVLVSEIFPNSPAIAAGFKEGDVVVEFAGKPIHNPRDLQELVEQSAPDSKQSVKVLRDGKPVTLTVHVEALPQNFGRTAANNRRRDEDSSKAGYHNSDLGIEVTDVTAEQAEKLGFANHKGVVVSDVESDSVAAEAGLREGAMILKVGNKSVENVEQFKAAMKDQSVDSGVLLLIRTEMGNRFVVLRKSS